MVDEYPDRGQEIHVSAGQTCGGKCPFRLPIEPKKVAVAEYEETPDRAEKTQGCQGAM